jgi:hypothetical protein
LATKAAVAMFNKPLHPYTMTSSIAYINVVDLTTTYVLAVDIGFKICGCIVMNKETQTVIVWDKFEFYKPYSAINIPE